MSSREVELVRRELTARSQEYRLDAQQALQAEIRHREAAERQAAAALGCVGSSARQNAVAPATSPDGKLAFGSDARSDRAMRGSFFASVSA